MREDPALLLNALPDAIIAIDRQGAIQFANSAAEQFFLQSEIMLKAKTLDALIAPASPLLALVETAWDAHGNFAEYDLDLALSNGVHAQVDVRLGPLGDDGERLFLQFEQRTIAEKISRQLTHRGAARSVAGAAQMLAHEIKNPLSGIRGAAQLLEDSVESDSRPLAQLICKEVDRISSLVDSMESFSDSRPLVRKAENIHAILDHVVTLAKAGEAKGCVIHQRYDPSLPMVDGNWDQLVQVFLNLVKNAAEALEGGTGEITVSTAYSHGMRIQVMGSNERVTLPIEVTITDTGKGIEEDLKTHLFDPFVSNKANGKGLGLALVAKVVGDHGGVVDCESRPSRTVFRVLLPAVKGSEDG